jgi:hypothetical protein
MMAAVEKVARFMATGDDAHLQHAFADSNVTIIENFAPYVFQGPDAVQQWARLFKAHATGLANLQVSFGEAHDFSVDGDLAYFSLPTTWTGTTKGRKFSEDGGWAFVLVRHDASWRVQNYGWAVTRYSLA